MATELELKAVVPDPDALRRALLAAGARCTFRGRLRDRRLDRAGALVGRDEVLRLRRWIPDQGDERAEVAWKGPASVGPAGYKHRQEFEYGADDGDSALAVFTALGFVECHAIDRVVEVYRTADGVARLEWYPRMDVLVEIEGTPAGIERLIQAAGLDRATCLPDALSAFAARFEARTGRPAVLAEALLQGDAPGWVAR